MDPVIRESIIRVGHRRPPKGVVGRRYLSGIIRTWDKLVHYLAQMPEPVSIQSRPSLSSLNAVSEKVAVALWTNAKEESA
jgi:hypothetical protein